MQGGHAPGRQCRAVGHADGAGHAEFIEANTTRRNRVNIWCFENLVAVAPKVIPALLIRHKQDEIGLFCHH
jgi:hypothetical protein